jgi:hypothetical protein
VVTILGIHRARLTADAGGLRLHPGLLRGRSVLSRYACPPGRAVMCAPTRGWIPRTTAADRVRKAEAARHVVQDRHRRAPMAVRQRSSPGDLSVVAGYGGVAAELSAARFRHADRRIIPPGNGKPPEPRGGVRGRLETGWFLAGFPRSRWLPRSRRNDQASRSACARRSS